MIGLGALAGLFAIYALWVTRNGATPKGKWFTRFAIAMPFLPLFGMSMGWIFTEMARQPWVVFGLMQTSAGVSPGVSAAQVLTSMVVLTLLYAGLAVIEFGLLIKAIKLGPPAKVEVPEDANPQNDRVLTFSY
jgi:cytochrome d ubiquinol oxidase subunit I